MTDSVPIAAADKVTVAGRYQHTMEFYHSDCCDGPSISSSEIAILATECPAKYWVQSSLNPKSKRENNKNFNIGTAAHLLLLEPHLFNQKVVIVNADDWRTNAAKLARENALKIGKTPLLKKELEPIQAMRDAIMADPVASLGLTDGKAEQSYYVKHEETGIWLKARPDYDSDKASAIIDYKTAADVNPEELSRGVANNSYFIRAAFQKTVIDTVTGRDNKYWFVSQEKEEPYLVTTFCLDDVAMEWGKLLAGHALRQFAKYLKIGSWPSYSQAGKNPGEPMVIGLPKYFEYRLNERHENGEFS